MLNEEIRSCITLIKVVDDVMHKYTGLEKDSMTEDLVLILKEKLEKIDRVVNC